MKEENYQITSWLEYWKIFDLLNSDNIAVKFKDVQKYANGLTDGWYEFKLAFEKSLNANRQNVTEEQNHIANFLLTTLNKSLTNR